MSRKKPTENRKTEILEEFWTEVDFICPVRGKVKQKVKGTRYKPLEYKQIQYVEEIYDTRDTEDTEDL